MEEYERRIVAKTQSSNISTISSNASSGSDKSLDDFQARILKKSLSIDSHDSRSSQQNDKSMKHYTSSSFEQRIMDKGKSARGGGGQQSNIYPPESSSSQVAAAADPQTEQEQKRAAIQKVMKDSALNPQERNRRMQSIIRGDYSAAESGGGSANGSRRISDEDEDETIARQRAIIEAKLGASSESNNRAPKPLANRSQQPSNRGFDPDAFLDDDDEGDHYGGDGGGGNPWEEIDVSYLSVSVGPPVLRPVDDNDDDGRRGVGYGSMPQPEEHFVQARDNRYRPLEELEAEIDADNAAIDADPDSAGLAVATAIADDEEPDYVYNAVEYDPDAKPPLHKNRRFRAYAGELCGCV